MIFDSALRDRFVANLGMFERKVSPGDGLRAAAVAVTIVGNESGSACFLLTRRSADLKRHAAQWAIPGGRIDDGEDVIGAALRELDEELGLRLPPADVIGMLDDYPTRSGYLITPVVVWGPASPVLVLQRGEVESAHVVPLAELDRPDVPRLIDGADPDRPVIQLPLYGRYVHAPTAAILYQVREVAMHGRSTRVAHFDQPPFAWR